MYLSHIDIDETHIRLTTDLASHDLKRYIYNIRRDLKEHILKYNDFSLSIEPLQMPDENLSEIVFKMYESSTLAEVGPMACVAGSVSEMALNYLINCGSRYSIVENGGDISLLNDKKVLCGIYSNNDVLGNNIAFEIKKRKKPLGICTSSGKIGHSISFGNADGVTVIGKSSSLCDGLATRIANSAVGLTSEDMAVNALECCDNYNDLFEGVLVICGDNVATAGRLPRIVESAEFQEPSSKIRQF